LALPEGEMGMGKEVEGERWEVEVCVGGWDLAVEKP
jgi:hypothetical protein